MSKAPAEAAPVTVATTAGSDELTLNAEKPWGVLSASAADLTLASLDAIPLTVLCARATSD